MNLEIRSVGYECFLCDFVSALRVKVIAFSLQHIKDRLSNSIIAALEVVGGTVEHICTLHCRVDAFDIELRN